MRSETFLFTAFQTRSQKRLHRQYVRMRANGNFAEDDKLEPQQQPPPPAPTSSAVGSAGGRGRGRGMVDGGDLTSDFNRAMSGVTKQEHEVEVDEVDMSLYLGRGRGRGRGKR